LDSQGCWSPTDPASRSGTSWRGLRSKTAFPPGRKDGLTARQADVLALLSEGLGNAAIAARLNISAKTVDHHVSAIIAKLGVRSRHEAAKHAGRTNTG
jgi:DNA-binding NarL/FixJ family response regulator